MTDTPKFDSPDAIDLHYAQVLAATPEDQRVAVELEKAKATTDFYKEQGLKAQKDVWARDVLAKYPHARLSDLRGDTEAKLEKAAKEAHERIETVLKEREAQIREELEKQLGKQAYAGGGAGGGAPIADQKSPEAVFTRTNAAFENRNKEFGKRIAKEDITREDLAARQTNHVNASVGHLAVQKGL